MSEKRWTITKWGSNAQAGSIEGPETDRIEVIPADQHPVLSQEQRKALGEIADWIEGRDERFTKGWVAFLRDLAAGGEGR